MGLTSWLFMGLLGFRLAHGLADTDTITWGGDNSRAGYQTTHNMDPAVVRSSQFDRLFRTQLPGNYGGVAEQIFSQPLVYTPDDTQYVYVSTTQNNVYKLDAQTGEILESRNLHIPFLSADLTGCNDIEPHIGITGTGVIDPETDTYYILAKTYIDQDQINVAQGRPAGRYYLHALDVHDLSERPNFPVNLEGTLGRNNPERMFTGGNFLQRPGLLHVGNWIYAGLGSHCVQYNFTGFVMGWDKTTGENIERYALQGDGVPNDIEGAGIWMSGGGIAYDGAGSIFFATGNGYASQLAEIPVNGREPPTALEEAAVHMAIQDDGKLDVVDFFMPEEKRELDGADMDLGTSPLQILPSEFSCGAVSRIGVVTGKSGKTYWLNLDDLGGYRMGGIGLDRVIQIYQHENSVYAGAGVYPGEGGYIYINVIRYPTAVFRFDCNGGVPSFNRVGQSPEPNAYVLGVSHGTVTSLDGQPGTGLLWTIDVQNPPGQFRIYDAVPSNGELVPVQNFEVPNIPKFTRAVFGDGIVYFGSTDGEFHAFGAPVNAPINCSSPVDFGEVDIEDSGDAQTLTCTAVIGVELTDISLRSESDFSISDLPSLPLTLTAGQTFSLDAVFSPSDVGLLSTDLNIESENSEGGYRTTTSVRLTGRGESAGPRITISPRSLSFENVILGSNVPPQNVVLRNQGRSILTVDDIQYATAINGSFESWDPSSGNLDIGPFTISNLPNSIAAGSGATVSVAFDPSSPGNYTGHVRVSSDGGNAEFTISAWSGPAPSALIEFQTIDGTDWVPYQAGRNFTFGNVTENSSRSLRMRVTNTAPPGGVRLSLTVSKPPTGASSLIRANNMIDLGEGTTIAPGESSSAVLYCSVPKRQWNMEPYDAFATWSMNTNDPEFEYHVIGLACKAVSQQAPPLLDNGLGQYRYLGCYRENNPGRQLQTQLYGSQENTIPMCIDACAEGNHIFCGTQYHSECWAGPRIPRERVADNNCNYDCSGDLNQICGGNGVGANAGGVYISLFADTLRFDGDNTTVPEPPVPAQPVVNPGVNGYVSIGCYTEATEGRALPYFHNTEEQTVGMCIEACEGSEYPLAGLQYGGECWCGNEPGIGSVPTEITECNMLCNGNSTEYCGGPSRLNVYQLGGEEPIPSDVDEETSSSASVTSASVSESLPASVSSSVSEESTPISSASSDFSSEVSSETPSEVPSETSSTSSSAEDATTSDSDITTSSSTTTTTTTSPTAAPTPERVESIGGWTLLGCYTEGDGTRALNGGFLADDELTLNMCADHCEGFTYFGTEYGRECWCGDTLDGGSSPAPNQEECSMTCGGNPSQFCGAGNRLEMYQFGGAAAEDAISSEAPTESGSAEMTTEELSISSSDAASSSISNSSPEADITASESSSSIASVSESLSVSASEDVGETTTPALPSSLASSSASEASSGVESSSEGISSSATSSSADSSSAISSTSSTTTSDSSTSSSSTATPSPEVFLGNKNWTYAGCFSEPEPGRLLPRQIRNDNENMTIGVCLKECDGFDYSGVEYGQECWCGNTLNLEGDTPSEGEPKPSELLDDEECDFLCPGNQTQFCGAGVKMSVYILRELVDEEDDEGRAVLPSAGS